MNPKILVMLPGTFWICELKNIECVDSLIEDNNARMRIQMNQSHLYPKINQDRTCFNLYNAENIKILLNNCQETTEDERGERCYEICRLLLRCVENDIDMMTVFKECYVNLQPLISDSCENKKTKIELADDMISILNNLLN